jgi:hypothetical protein
MKEALDAVSSYGLAAIGFLLSIAEDLQSATIVVSFAILVVRLIYDAFRLYRYITRK